MATMTQANSEEAKLIDRIKASGFIKTKRGRNLLQFLFDHRAESLSAKEIEVDHFNRPIGHPGHNETNSRVACGALRRELDDYAKSHPGESLKCELPNAKLHGGFQLHFAGIDSSKTETELFWKPHLGGRVKTLVIGGDLLFFFELDADRVFRYYNVNLSLKEADPVASYKQSHPGDKDLRLEALEHSYLSTGEVRAFELLQQWFYDREGILLHRSTCRDISDAQIIKSAPILLGRPATNRFMKTFMSSPEGSSLGFHVDGPVGTIRISKITSKERVALANFPLSKEGVLGPSSGWKTIFGVVTRMPNPGGYGHLTIISADSQANVYSAIIEALTDNVLLKQIMAQAGWSLDSGIPDSFELLLAVTRSPAGMNGESKARLLLHRP
jgi:hypothetical protein